MMIWQLRASWRSESAITSSFPSSANLTFRSLAVEHVRNKTMIKVGEIRLPCGSPIFVPKNLVFSFAELGMLQFQCCNGILRGHEQLAAPS